MQQQVTKYWLTWAYKNGIMFKAKINTGAQMNVLAERILDKFRILVDLKPSKAKLEGYSGTNLENMGTIKLHCRSVKAESLHTV